MELDLSLRKVNNCSVVGRAAVFVRHKNSCLLHFSSTPVVLQGWFFFGKFYQQDLQKQQAESVFYDETILIYPFNYIFF